MSYDTLQRHHRRRSDIIPITSHALINAFCILHDRPSDEGNVLDDRGTSARSFDLPPRGPGGINDRDTYKEMKERETERELNNPRRILSRSRALIKVEFKSKVQVYCLKVTNGSLRSKVTTYILKTLQFFSVQVEERSNEM